MGQKKLHSSLATSCTTTLQTTAPWANEYTHASRTRPLQNCHGLSRCSASAPYKQPQTLQHAHNNLLQLDASTHIRTAVPPHDVQQVSWQAHSFFAIPRCLNLSSSPRQTNIFIPLPKPFHSAAVRQALDNSLYGGKVATCLDKTPHHHARQAHHGMHTD